MTAPTNAPNRRRGTRGPAPTSGANLRDVAARAGVSTSTASRVFAGSPLVRPDTRERVLAAAEELGYVVNGLAQAMMGRGRRSVAFLATHMIGATFAAMAAGAESVAADQGNLLIVSSTGDDVARERDLMETLREQRAAAVLFAGSTATGVEFERRIAEYAHDLETIGARLVLCGHPAIPALPNVLSVDYDQVGGVRTAMKHLTSAGHRRIAFIGTHPNKTSPLQRLRGYELGLRDAGLAIDPSLVIECANETEAAAHASLELLRGSDRPTAVVGVTDGVAIGVYRAARSLGLAIPADVAVVGFDDAPHMVDLTPSLTTIRAPFWEVGVRGARLALGLDEATGHVELPSRLVARESAP
ncbi:LacI family DNA-binding transcriptional regulator [Nonomuraea sp. NPDC005650]|uniref:LacI family DNA-binding transcriptional regulator n=1 Tax=Nonomuraea sp. NPDC005650 TaxID=3157045 RepID=UPI0033AAB218